MRQPLRESLTVRGSQRRAGIFLFRRKFSTRDDCATGDSRAGIFLFRRKLTRGCGFRIWRPAKIFGSFHQQLVRNAPKKEEINAAQRHKHQGSHHGSPNPTKTDVFKRTCGKDDRGKTLKRIVTQIQAETPQEEPRELVFGDRRGSNTKRIGIQRSLVKDTSSRGVKASEGNAGVRSVPP